MGKRPTSSSTSGHDPSDNKHEQKLQAVLFADSFIRTFRPVTLDHSKPKVLCPLNNVTMLDYSIEFLAGAGIEELFVFCVHGADEVERYVHQSSWSTVLQVHCVKDATCSNPGDALRELDKRGLIRSDPFVLMSGDVITNVDLTAALAAHARRHKADSAAIMTVLLKPVGAPGVSSAMSIRSTREDLVVALHPHTHRILMYDDKPNSASVKLPCGFFQACSSTLEVRNDLMPIGVDICSPGVLARFSDEFDYRDIYKQFVHDSVAEEEEGVQSKIYAQVLSSPSEYGARIVDFRTYHAVSRDIIRRWCYPVGLDNLPSGYETNYRYVLQRHFVYREVLASGHASEPGTKIARSTQIVSDTIIGANVQIGERCTVQGTVIGNYCDIGQDVTIKDCHLWEKVCILDNVTMEGCILCDGVVIRSGAKLGTGCVIGKGCIIGENVVIPPFIRITLCAKDEEVDGDDDAFSSSSSDGDYIEEVIEEDDEDDEEESDDEALSVEHDFVVLCDKGFVSDHDVVGNDGVGRVWHPPAPGDESDFESEEGDPAMGDIRTQSIGYDATELFKRRIELQSAQEAKVQDDIFSDDGEEDNGKEEESADGDVGYSVTAADSAFGTSNGLDEGGFAITGRQKGVDVIKELKHLCLEHDKSRDVTDLAIELNSFKFSQNATYSDCCRGAMLAVLEFANLTVGMSPLNMIKQLEKELKYWSPLFQKLSQGIEEERAIINVVESGAVGGGELGQVLSKAPAFRFVLQKLHDMEFVSEEAISAWAAERRRNEEDDANNPLVKLFLQQATQEFLEWLMEESDSDSDDEDDDDDDDSDE